MTVTPKITELWASAAAMRLFDTSELGFFVVTVAGTVLDANATFCKVMGYGREELIGTSVYDFTHADDHELTRNNISRAGAGPTLQVEKRYVTKGGDTIWVRLRSSPVGNDDGAVEYRIVMLENITAEKKNELFLEQMAAIVEQSDDAIFRTSPDGIIQFWSKGAERLYGYSAAEVLNRRSSFLPANLDDPKVVSVPARLMRGEVVTDPFGVTRHKDGRLLNVSVQLFPLTDAEGHTIAFAGVHRDVGDLKQLEERLRHAQRMETAGLLAGGIAHDFNNILTVIQGACSALDVDLPANSPLGRYLELIDRSADKASRLTRQLLAFSRQQTLVPELIDPSELLRDFSPMLVRTLGDNIELVLRLQSSHMVLQDPTQFEQVVLNLCVNARHAMTAGGRLTVEVSNIDVGTDSLPVMPGYAVYTPLQPAPGSYVMLTVSDNGSGMDSEVLQSIFEPFFTTRPRGEGTGLGLAVVYGVVSQSGGAIQVQSRAGGGSVFRILLPSVVGSALQQAQPPQVVGMGNRGRILIIEDDGDVRALVADMLVTAGFTVNEAGNPRDVLANPQLAQVDLILSDVVMPDMSGPEFASLWLEACPDAKFLFMSGYFDESRYPDQLANQALLLKPFKPGELISRIEQQLGR